MLRPFFVVCCMAPSDLAQLFGRIDIYLLDQILKGNIDLAEPILDAGCGGGRNAIYFMRQQAALYGIDSSQEAISAVQELSELLGYAYPERFSVNGIDEIPFEDAFFGTVICNAVLHFCPDETYFLKAVEECWRVLKPGGILFVRTAVKDGLENDILPVEGQAGWYHLPDGTSRFLVNMKFLSQLSEELGGKWVQALRSVLLKDMRSMGTWVLQKG